MSNLELLKDSIDYLKDYKVNINIYQNINDNDLFIVESNGLKSVFNAVDLKNWLKDLKDQIDDLEEQQAKKRRQFRSLLLEASEEIARKYNKQVYTLSIGDNKDE